MQEQNALTEHGIRVEASYWRSRLLPPALYEVGMSHGVDWDKSIIIDLDMDLPWMPDMLLGTLLTQEEKFIDFEIETDKQGQTAVTIEAWLDVTAQINTCEHNRGIGVGMGVLALKIRKELCGITEPQLANGPDNKGKPDLIKTDCTNPAF
ncbi:hypothetical protein [Undibacterium sp. TS12]|uniref:hypothetical protein n=1 Tax=Undibacterium sp. TS12 TaxID=2908202 RepID=UPI001F4C9ED1|nr:hypothetical protein [Undibacterium sp. TS12]MCH8622807.1 hypothetical protein [Undibacterium sp. TS12]